MIILKEELYAITHENFGVSAYFFDDRSAARRQSRYAGKGSGGFIFSFYFVFLEMTFLAGTTGNLQKPLFV